MQYVVDCSFSSPLILLDEESGIVREFFSSLGAGDQVHVPMLWWYETANVLSISVIRKRLSHNDASGAFESFNKFGLITDLEFGPQFSKELLQLSQMYHVTSYDAAYLELAQRIRAKLMSLDNKLLAAAKKFGIK